jgi:predicted DNA-binding transcriptional regulator YafY
VIRKGKNIFYTYSEDFELNAQTITKDESLSLIMANEVLSQLKGFTLTKELKDLTDKLKLHIDDNMQSNSPAVIFDVQPDLKHIEQLQDFLECILEKTVLQISYQPFGIATTIEKIIHPYFLKQYNQRWFLFGYDEANKRIDNSPVDRIIQFKPVNRPFIENSFFLQHEYFNDMVGVTKKEGQKAEHIMFEVSAAKADYLVTKPLHQSQTILSRQSNGNITFQMDVIINKELVSMLLSFGSDLVVIAPSLLKQVLETEFKNCYKQYSEPA